MDRLKTQGFRPPWTGEEAALLLELRKTMSPAELARELTWRFGRTVSLSAVIGKLDRLSRKRRR